MHAIIKFLSHVAISTCQANYASNIRPFMLPAFIQYSTYQIILSVSKNIQVPLSLIYCVFFSPRVIHPAQSNSRLFPTFRSLQSFKDFLVARSIYFGLVHAYAGQREAPNWQQAVVMKIVLLTRISRMKTRCESFYYRIYMTWRIYCYLLYRLPTARTFVLFFSLSWQFMIMRITCLGTVQETKYRFHYSSVWSLQCSFRQRWVFLML